jgi:peroxiredoxin
MRRFRGNVKLCAEGAGQMRRAITAICLFLAAASAAWGAEREAEFRRLSRDWDVAMAEYRKIPSTNSSTTAEKIHRYEVWPGLQYIPRFVALAEARPDDEVAFRACLWCVALIRGTANQDRRIFPDDQRVWEILAAHHARRPELASLCLSVVDRWWGPAQERFLRGVLGRQDLSREQRGIATAALGEFLAHEYELIETFKPFDEHDEFGLYLGRVRWPGWGSDLVPANGPRFKAESVRLLREVEAQYAEIPLNSTVTRFDGFKTLGEKARTSLHDLEHLTIGSQSPRLVGTDLGGKPLDLAEYRGRIVLVTFWFTGCPQCMHELPLHQRLLETHKGRPFAIVSVCTDESLEHARKTVAAKQIAWPCLFDGANGPLAHEWNVLTSPAAYVLDQGGVIRAKNIQGEQLDGKIAELLGVKKGGVK